MHQVPRYSFLVVLLALLFSAVSGSAQEATPRVEESCNSFGIALFKRLVKTEGNFVFSPYSLNEPLGFLAAAADGETRAEIQAATRYPESIPLLESGMEALRKAVLRSSEKSIVQSSTALWVQNGIPLQASFLEKQNDIFGVAAGRMDLVHGLEDAQKNISLWAEQNTGGFLSDPLGKDGLRRSSLVLLFNAFYLRSSFRHPFSSTDTRMEVFANASGNVRVPVMHQQGTFDYYDSGAVELLAMPLRDRELELVLLLPRDTEAMTQLCQRLTLKDLVASRAKTWQRELDLQIPLFQAKTPDTLAPELKALGIEDAFTDKARFPHLMQQVNAPIDRFSQLFGLRIDETGIATTESSSKVSRVAKPLKEMSVAFHANRPFLFLVWKRDPDLLLAMGRIDSLQGEDAPEDPAESDEFVKPSKPKVVFRETPGFGPWNFGKPIGSVPAGAGGPFRYLSGTNQFLTNNAIWNNRTGVSATLGFNEKDELATIQLDVFASPSDRDLRKHLIEMLTTFQKRYGGVVFERDGAEKPQTAEAIADQMIAQLMEAKALRPHEPVEVKAHPRLQPPQTWISGHLLYEKTLGYHVYLRYRWDPGFPGSPLPQEAAE